MSEATESSVAACLPTLARACLWLCACGLLLAGCGQKGPLSLPAALPAAAPAAASAPAR